MKHPVPLFVAALCVALPTLVAQEAKKNAPPATGEMQAPPNPKTAAHDALKAFAGTWDCTTKMTEAGSDKAVEAKGVERAELVCNGLWLKSLVTGELAGAPFAGVWVLGYDPSKKVYVGVWGCNTEPAPCQSEGRYDAKTNTWEFTGSGEMGSFKSKLVMKDADNSVETCECTDPSGKPSTMVITRKRAKAVAADAGAKAGKAPTKEHEELLKCVGEWEGTFKMAAQPGAAAKEPKDAKETPTEAKCTEKVIPICEGHYLWTNYAMDFMGGPYEGHALVGYDATKKRYVSYWFDSMTPTFMASSGTLDPKTRTLTMTGTSVGHDGKPRATKEVDTWKDDNTRHMAMEMKGDNDTEGFEITLRRKG